MEVLVGDYNFPDICRYSLSGTSSFSNYFCEFIFDYNLTQHVMEPTHIMGNILDLVVTSPSVNILTYLLFLLFSTFHQIILLSVFVFVIKFLLYVVSQGMCLIFLKLIWIVCSFGCGFLCLFSD